MLDRGLREQQRALLGAEARVVPSARVPHAMLAKPSAVRLGLEGTLVFVDSDALVCAPLAPIVERARAGAVCLYPDHPTTRGKRQEEWLGFFELDRPPRAQTYGNAGFVAFATDAHPTLLRRWGEACRRFSASWPDWTTTPDQDALNALLMSEIPAEAVELLPEWEGPLLEALDEVSVLDERTLAATAKGRQVHVLHYVLGPKPWDRRAWVRVRRDAYVTLLLRSLWGEGVPLRMAPDDVPPWLRPGRAGRAARAALGATHRGTVAMSARLPSRMRGRLLGLRDRLVS